MPAVDEVPLRVTWFVTQVSMPDTWASTSAGTRLFCLTTTENVEVHPFTGFVAVTVYVPGCETLAVADVGLVTGPGPAQLKVTPLVVDVAAMFTLVTEQVNSADTVAVSPAGGVMLL
jgi:hypothetical protein